MKFQEVTGTPGFASSAYASLKTPLLFDPGTRWEYGINTDWVGVIVQKVSGRSLSDYFAEHIFKPLGITDTAIRMRPDMLSRFASVHARMPDGGLVPIDLVLPQEPETEMGGQALYGTAGDYLKFMRLFLNQGAAPGGRVLKAETVAAMTTNQIGALTVAGLKSQNPQFLNDVVFTPGVTHKFGLGFLINEQALPTGRKPGSLEWDGICNTYFWIDPVSGVAGVYLTQILPFADVKSRPLFVRFETTVYKDR